MRELALVGDGKAGEGGNQLSQRGELPWSGRAPMGTSQAALFSAVPLSHCALLLPAAAFPLLPCTPLAGSDPA